MPPPLTHITQNYTPLNELILKFSLQVSNEITNILRTSENLFSNMARKEQFLKFVVAARQEYVKLYVLLKWAVVYKDVSMSIDVTNFLHGQINCFLNVVNALFQLQQSLGPAKSPYADLETALQVLQMGEPIPNNEVIKFIPQKRLENKQILRVLRRLDVLIAMRLSLNEQLPSHYQNYKVLNGRARFEIGQLFLELSIADEDLLNKSRFFFVDFGLKTQTINLKLKSAIESVVNKILLELGLLSALDFMSKLGAVYKLQTLNKQLLLAEDSLEVWHGVINHQFKGDSIVINVFVGTKDICQTEVFISPNAPFTLQTKQDFDFDINQINLTRHAVNQFLSRVTEFYAAEKMHEVRAPFLTKVGKFKVSFNAIYQIELSIDPTSGLYALNGNGPLFTEMQQRLNTLKGLSVVESLSKLRAQVQMDTIATRAEAAGWRAQRNVKLAPDEYLKISPFRYLLTLRLKNDFSGWSLCATFGSDLNEPKWFASRVLCDQSRMVLGPKHELNLTDLEMSASDPDYQCFFKLKRVYKSMFVLFELMRELTQKGVSHEMCSKDGINVVIANIRQIIPGAQWAQSGLICSVNNNDMLVVEGRSKHNQLQALGEITEVGSNADIFVNGHDGRFVVSSKKAFGCFPYLQTALGQLHYAASSLTSATSLGLEVRRATLSSLEIMYVKPSGILMVQNNADIIFGPQNPQKLLAPFLPKVEENSKHSLVRIVTFLRQWYPVFSLIEQHSGAVVLPQSINKLRVQFRTSVNAPFIEITLRNFRRLKSVNFITAGNGAEKNAEVVKYFTNHVVDGVVPLVTGCALDIGREEVLGDILKVIK